MGNILQGAASAGVIHSFCNFFSWKAMGMVNPLCNASLYGTGRRSVKNMHFGLMHQWWCTRTRNLHKPFQVANIIS